MFCCFYYLIFDSAQEVHLVLTINFILESGISSGRCHDDLFSDIITDIMQRITQRLPAKCSKLNYFYKFWKWKW